MVNPKNPLTVRVILQLLVFIVLVPFLPLIISSRPVPTHGSPSRLCGRAVDLLRYSVPARFLLDVCAVIFITVVIVIRTALEDRTLQEELPGYKEYPMQKTRYRLLPGIW